MRRAVALTMLVLAACGKTPPPEGETVYAGPYDAVVVETADGRIEFQLGASDTDIGVTKLPSDGVETITDGEGQLAILASCPGSEDVAGCGNGFILTVPAGITIAAKTTSGEIAFVGALDGLLQAATGSGDIRVDGVAGPELVAQTGTGAVVATFGDEPVGITCDAGASDIDVTVPSGTYTLELEGASVDVGDGIEEGEGPVLHLDSGTGNVTLTGS